MGGELVLILNGLDFFLLLVLLILLGYNFFIIKSSFYIKALFMPPLKIRYKFGFIVAQLIAAFFLLFLSAYTASMPRIVLACFWLLIGFINLVNNSVLELNSKEIIVKNGLGLVAKRYAINKGAIEVKRKQIYLNNKKIYTHSFFFDEEDFVKVRDYLTTNNPNLNLGRHLIAEDED
jgi:hypothetical protein